MDSSFVKECVKIFLLMFVLPHIICLVVVYLWIIL